MVSFSAIMSAVTLASTYSVAQAEPVPQPLPWDGRAFDLTVATIEKKYMPHIMTMRNDSSLTVADYLTIDQKGRPKAYNGDTGVLYIAVDKNAIFKSQTDFRRTELAQVIAANPNGKTFFRTSLKKEKPFENKHVWQCILDEHQAFQIRIDAVVDPPIMHLMSGGTWDSKWNITFEFDTWYNFGIALSAAPSGSGHVIEFYMSENDEDLKLTVTNTHEKELPTQFEYHIGMLTLTDDKTDPVMNGTDIMSYNGVTVTADVSTAGVKGGSACTARKKAY